ncbi:MAG: hypothetical protein IJD45_05525 [Clostridia bacterium]|nr:hypothetical protein [Clostridia bacterium]
MKKIIYFLSATFILMFAVLILKNPNPCIKATSYSINLCARVLIPSLFPFTFCVLFILNTNILNKLNFFDRLLKKLFGMDSYLFSVFFLSLIGGYPLGAKLINDSQIDKKTAEAMLNYCVNAGPAFIITAVGNGIFNSHKIGVILFVCHILPPFILAFLFRKKLSANKCRCKNSISIADNFVMSATSSAAALINICTFVLLFSVITAYFQSFALLKPITLLLEVTNSISHTNNILLISALLGFGGISIWCQVYSLSQKAKPAFLTFPLCRIFHAFSSATFTYIAIKLFGVTMTTLSNGKEFGFTAFTNSTPVGFSLIILCILFMISLNQKNYTGNMLEDIV